MYNWHVGNSVCDSQNFVLQLSEDSVATSSTDDSSLQRYFTATKKYVENDVIVISDSSCGSSPEHTDVSKWKSTLTSSLQNKEYRKLHLLEVSSDSEKERESDSPSRSNDKFSKKKSVSKTVVQVDKASSEASLISNDLTSDRLFDALLASSNALTNNKTDIGSSVKCNGDQMSKSKRFTDKSKRHIDRSPMLITDQEVNSKLREKYNTEERNELIKSTCATYDNPNVLGKHLVFNTPKQDSTGKARLKRHDMHRILQNIRYTQVMYESPREKKENNVIIDESTDIEEDMLHPAISPNCNRKVQHANDSDIIDTTPKNAILQVNSAESCKSHLNISRVMDSFRPLSEKKKKEIREWLLTNFSDSQSDGSFNTVPPSARNSNSGNSSLERLEQTYETPNNRGRINKTPRTDERRQKTIANSDNVTVHSLLTRPKTLDQYFKQTKKSSEYCTPDNKQRLLPKAQTETTKETTLSVINTFETKTVTDCADILDKLYGTSWRDKANAVLSTGKPKKPFIQSTSRIVQTERKPVSKNQYRVDLNKSDIVENNIKPNRGRNVQRKQKKVNDFINDDSLSSNSSESIYHSALTNPTTFISSTTKKSVSVPASIKRLQTLCDTDTEDEIDKSSSPKSLHGRKLSFSDDESSSTSEFDPGDYVPPKFTSNKVNGSQSTKVATKFESTKSVGCETFLASLSNAVPMYHAHPNAKKYRLDYKNNKEELCKKLYELYNEKIFDNKLPGDMLIEWNVRMRGTAGYCYNKKSVKSLGGVIKSSRIVLATKILDTPDRLRDTLIHEMCHAASWIIDNVSDGHGHFWTRWANKAMKTFPELPPIRRCHNYEIKTKFTYKCTSCGYSIGRHSKSLDIEKKRCGYCFGKFELLLNRTTKSGTVQQVQTPKREPTGFALYVKQNYNSVKKEQSNMRHADVMKLLGQQFSAIKIAKKTDVTSN
ncbi:uncharacterized protein LOC105840891 [Monomorium pharaonis]|uniref:uncharacterized protein LOC105840891 n=1 Tax=Monomorium pharaonis TaxID=307658 RepID=UPI00063FB5D5|nr:uncharacterized protein LOC105840891 [Monomorium pharaonis]